MSSLPTAIFLTAFGIFAINALTFTIHPQFTMWLLGLACGFMWGLSILEILDRRIK